MQLFRVANGTKYKLDDPGHYIMVKTDVFTDHRVGPAEDQPISHQLGWLAILIAAKKLKNRVPFDEGVILREAALPKKVKLNLQKFLDLGLIEIIEGEAKENQTEKKERKPPARAVTWVQVAVGVWEERFGAGSGANLFGRLGKSFKRLIEAHGEEAVIAAWKRYLDSTQNPTEERFLSPELFTSKYASWSGQQSAMVAPQKTKTAKELLAETMRREEEAQVG